MKEEQYTRFWHRSLPDGLSYSGGVHDATRVDYLADKTWTDDSGERHVEQEIFDAVFDMIARARRLIVLDMFLYNDFQAKKPETTRRLSSELTAALVKQVETHPEIRVVVITDPINTLYGSYESPDFARLAAAGGRVVITDLTRLRDSNPLYSFVWRTLLRPLGNSGRGRLPNPFDRRGRATLRSYLEMLNFKANHRKLVVADDADELVGLVTSANPHDASSAHANVAVRFTGAAVENLLQTEIAILQLSGADPQLPALEAPCQSPGMTVQVLTERAIKTAALELIASAAKDEHLDLATFYLSDRDVIAELKRAKARGVCLRVLLDPNKDAFGHSKFGIPNRSVAAELVRAGIEVRWSHTHGEQCHVKMLCKLAGNGDGSLLLGSANLTRRNLDDFNLETNVLVRGPGATGFVRKVQAHFDLLWYNEPGRTFTVPYEHYRNESIVKTLLYRFMEATGFCTF